MSEVFIPGEDSMGMTDLQFISYKEERDKTEEALRQEINRLRGSVQTVTIINTLRALLADR